MRTTRTGAGSAPGPPVDADQYDWSARDGVIRGRRMLGQASARNVNRFYNPDQDNSTPSEAAQSLLSYHRPLRDGDVLSYEFLYEPGQVMVHPALDRLAFLLEPAGVRLHWMTTGAERHVGPPGRQRRRRPRASQGTGPTPPQAERLEHAEALDRRATWPRSSSTASRSSSAPSTRATPASSASITTRS